MENNIKEANMEINTPVNQKRQQTRLKNPKGY